MVTTDWPVHPAAELFPMLDARELKILAEDIEQNGLHEPLWLWFDPERGEVLLDGRNRLAACRQVEVEPAVRHYLGDDPITFVISLNINRRHLNESQRAGVAVKAEPLYAVEAAERKGGRPRNDEQKPGADRHQVSKRAPRAADQAAAVTGASGRLTGRMKRLYDNARDLFDEVMAGRMKADRAERMLKDRIAEARRSEEAKARALAMPFGPRVELLHGDFRDVLASIEPGSIDVIITDPPYPAEFLPLYAGLAECAARLLKPGGLCAVMSGQTHLPQVMAALGSCLDWHWPLAYLTPGGQAVQIFPRKVNTFWKPILIYRNGDGPDIEWFGDVAKSDANDNDKRFHHWGQSESGMADVVRRLSRPGDLVLDPFMGAGTTGLAALSLDRGFIGCDIDAEFVAIARERMGLES